MIKVEVRKGYISVKGHANYADIGKDIVCAAVSSIVICSTEAIARFDNGAVDVKRSDNLLEIFIKKEDYITKNLVDNMIVCLKEVSKKYPKNIQITNKEE